jgi:hypothetical protein
MGEIRFCPPPFLFLQMAWLFSARALAVAGKIGNNWFARGIKIYG